MVASVMVTFCSLNICFNVVYSLANIICYHLQIRHQKAFLSIPVRYLRFRLKESSSASKSEIDAFRD